MVELAGVGRRRWAGCLRVVGSERGNFVAVYEYLHSQAPAVFRQFLPTGIGPEGLVTIPSRDLLVVANEAASPEDGIYSTIMVYQLVAGAPTYPFVASADVSADRPDRGPIPWGTLSGLVADPENPGTLYAVPDSYYGRSRIFTLDVSGEPAVITEALELSLDGEPVDLDLEGIALRPGGGWWLASEGSGSAPDIETTNQLVAVEPDGSISEVVELPDEVAELQRNNGYEGVAVTGEGDDEAVWVAFQREWADEPYARIGRYLPATGEWGFLFYPLDEPESPNGGWVGLSEITVTPEGEVWVLERDNQLGRNARIKKLYAVDLSGLDPAPVGEEPPVIGAKTLVADLLEPLAQATNGIIQDKPEGLAVDADGQVYVVTDNDGVDGSTGETVLLRLGGLG